MSATATRLAGSRRGIITAWRLMRFDSHHAVKPQRRKRRKQMTADGEGQRSAGERHRPG